MPKPSIPTADRLSHGWETRDVAGSCLPAKCFVLHSLEPWSKRLRPHIHPTLPIEIRVARSWVLNQHTEPGPTVRDAPIVAAVPICPYIRIILDTKPMDC